MFKNKVLVVILLFICWTVYAAVDENMAVKKEEIVSLRKEVANLKNAVDELKNIISDLRSSGALVNNLKNSRENRQAPKKTSQITPIQLPSSVGKPQVARDAEDTSYSRQERVR